MRNTIYTLACLMLLAVNNLTATSNPETVITDSKTSKTIVAKKLVELIPGKTLDVKINSENTILEVNLTGTKENLEWIIFQPNVKLISKISTASKFTEIKIDNLEAGQYVLMIKDNSGRILHKAFTKK